MGEKESWNGVALAEAAEKDEMSNFEDLNLEKSLLNAEKDEMSTFDVSIDDNSLSFDDMNLEKSLLNVEKSLLVEMSASSDGSNIEKSISNEMSAPKDELNTEKSSSNVEKLILNYVSTSEVLREEGDGASTTSTSSTSSSVESESILKSKDTGKMPNLTYPKLTIKFVLSNLT
jgi:hypothetical protein